MVIFIFYLIDVFRFAIAVVVVQEADVYMFDEPSSYLDVKQRLKAAAVIRGLVTHQQGIYCVYNTHTLCF